MEAGKGRRDLWRTNKEPGGQNAFAARSRHQRFTFFSADMAYSVNNPAGKVVDGVLSDLPGLLAVAVVDMGSGMSLASHSNSPSINPDTAAAYNTEVVKQKQKAISALKLTSENIEDILFTLSNQLHLIRLASNGAKFIYLVVNSRDTNLAIAREVLREHASQLN